MQTEVSLDSVGPLVNGCHENPFELLGPHRVVWQGHQALAVRAFLPDTARAYVVDDAHGQRRPMRRIHPAGLYEAICPMEDGNSARLAKGNYHYSITDSSGNEKTMKDPYAYPPLLTDYDLHLLGEGNHWDCYRRLGAHLRVVDGQAGVNFAVWAPNAEGVSLVGDFKQLDRQSSCNAEARPRRRVGVVHSRIGSRSALQIRG